MTRITDGSVDIVVEFPTFRTDEQILPWKLIISPEDALESVEMYLHESQIDIYRVQLNSGTQRTFTKGFGRIIDYSGENW